MADPRDKIMIEYVHKTLASLQSAAPSPLFTPGDILKQIKELTENAYFKADRFIFVDPRSPTLPPAPSHVDPPPIDWNPLLSLGYAPSRADYEALDWGVETPPVWKAPVAPDRRPAIERRIDQVVDFFGCPRELFHPKPGKATR